jgi:hypothetical protein
LSPTTTGKLRSNFDTSAKGRNEITEEAKRRALQEKKSVAEVLEAMLAEAKAAKDMARVKKIEQAQKYMGQRNIRKRRDTR